jgi:hypothetical protein
MNKVNHKQVLKDALNWTKQTYLSNPNELNALHGICKAVEHYCYALVELNHYQTEEVHYLLRKLIESWPLCATYNFADQSGQLVKNTTFPITDGSMWFDERVNGTIWNNLKRLELLEYLIQEVNKDE